MNDFYSPLWAQHRGRFAADVAALARAGFGALDHAFGRLSARRFDAPWRRARDVRFSGFR